MAKPTTQRPGGTGDTRQEFTLGALEPDCAQKHPISVTGSRLSAWIAGGDIQDAVNRSWGILAVFCWSFPQNPCGLGKFSWVKTHPPGGNSLGENVPPPGNSLGENVPPSTYS